MPIRPEHVIGELPVHQEVIGDNVVHIPEPNLPKCPTCQSTDLQKIGTVRRAFSFGLKGFASSSVGKQFECNNCGYKW